MRALLLYIIQVIIASGILYGYYHLFLRNKKFHQYNRFYLLLSISFSLLIPILKIPIYYTTTTEVPAFYQLLTTVNAGYDYGSGDIQNPLALTVYSLFKICFVLISTAILIHVIIGLFKLLHLYRKYSCVKTGGIILLNSSEKNTPYSFFSLLVWDKNVSITSEKGQQMLRHELFHIKEKHSLDILYLEILMIFFWINPFLFLIKREIKTIHEFLADDYAIGSNNKWNYAELLLMQVFQTHQTLVTPFFHNQIKRRIAMITNSSTQNRSFVRKLLAVPLILVLSLILAVNCKTGDTKPNQPIETNENATSTHDSQVISTESLAEFNGGKKAWTNFLSTNLNSSVPLDNGAPAGKYTVKMEFVINKDGSLSNIIPITKHGYGMEEEVIRILKQSPKWTAAQKNGHLIASYKQQPVTFEITEE